VETSSSIFSDENGQAENKPALPGGQQILLRPGDAVLLHQKVAHRVGVNVSPHIRYQTYFRLNHVDHDQQKFEALTDVWLAWEGVRPLGRPH